MEKADFDANETIAGFSLAKIQQALGFVGFLEDRDDVEHVSEALRCPRGQAERVLRALERRGFVTPSKVKNQWDKTELGRQLVHHWKRPPKLDPAIALDDEDDSQAYNRVFDSVRCSILRTTDDNEDAFEEGNLDVGVWVDYASPRVIQISVAVPDDYDNEDSDSTIESTVYVGVEEAKRFAQLLQTAIEQGEAELQRRAKLKPRPKPETQTAHDSAATRPANIAASKASRETTPASSTRAHDGRAATAAKQAAERAADKKRHLEARALEATMRELGTKPRGRKEKPKAD